MKRGKPLKSDPAKAAEWRRRSRKQLPNQSEKRRAMKPERDLVREAVFLRDQMKCRLATVQAAGPCGYQMTVHHLKKASAGGAYSLENLVTLCAVHNDWCEDHPIAAAHLGMVIR